MRFLSELVALNLCFCSLTSAARPKSQESEDYGFGLSFGECIASGCEIFSGTILTDPPRPDGTIKVRVDKPLYGMSAPRASGAQYPDFEFSYDRWGAWAWANVPIAKNLHVTVLVGLHGSLMTRPGEPGLVATDERDISIIRFLADEANRLDRSPDLISGAVASLSEDPKPALAGYLFSRLVYCCALAQPKLFGDLLLQMLPNRSVPPDGLEEIARRLSLTYGLLSDEGKEAVLRRFTDLGEQSDVPSAKAAYVGLAHIATYFPIRTTIPPATLVALENSYRAVVKKGSIPRNKALEAGLGFRIE